MITQRAGRRLHGCRAGSSARAPGLALVAVLGLSTAAMAQAAVQSDTPVPARAPAAAGLGATLPAGDAASRGSGFPNPLTAPGSPGTTGTGAAGTGPSNTMAAPGR